MAKKISIGHLLQRLLRGVATLLWKLFLIAMEAVFSTIEILAKNMKHLVQRLRG